VVIGAFELAGDFIQALFQDFLGFVQADLWFRWPLFLTPMAARGVAPVDIGKVIIRNIHSSAVCGNNNVIGLVKNSIVVNFFLMILQKIIQPFSILPSRCKFSPSPSNLR